MEDIWSIPRAKPCKRSNNFLWKAFCVSICQVREISSADPGPFFLSIGRDGARLPVCFTEEASWNAGTSSKMSFIDNERLST